MYICETQIKRYRIHSSKILNDHNEYSLIMFVTLFPWGHLEIVKSPQSPFGYLYIKIWFNGWRTSSQRQLRNNFITSQSTRLLYYQFVGTFNLGFRHVEIKQVTIILQGARQYIKVQKYELDEKVVRKPLIGFY